MEETKGTLQEEYENFQMTKRVDHPDYYNTNNPSIVVTAPNSHETFKVFIECIDVIRDMPTWKGNAIKYLWREGLKSENGISDIDKSIEDLCKAIWYIKDRIEKLRNEKCNINKQV